MAALKAMSGTIEVAGDHFMKSISSWPDALMDNIFKRMLVAHGVTVRLYMASFNVTAA